MQVHKPRVVALLEPRVSGNVRQAVWQKLQFNCSFVVEAQGFSGGIWLLWNDFDTNIKIIDSSHQFIHALIEWETGKSFVATFIYAAPSLLSRRMLWNDLRRLSRMPSQAWILMGDFNAMTESSEKRGGAKCYQGPARVFHDCIRDCNLMDSGFVVPKFTWFRRILKERLDRCLGNAIWFNLFPYSTTYHIERLKSDHRPILVRTLKLSSQNLNPRPFRFNAAWFVHENFTDFLDQNWKRGRDFCLSLQDFQEQVITWNKEVFGHIFQRKRVLEKRLKQLQFKNQSGGSSYWAGEEDKVHLELEKTPWQENMLWRQKSRVQWIKEGDRNTKFFHLSTVHRRTANRIQSLTLGDGSWSFDDEEMKGFAISHFQDLFRAG
ncbi:hypothetical protein LINPERHAP1_LOCUS3970 [Linum perenne]